MLDKVEVALAACAEVNTNRLLHAVSERGFNDGFDRRKPGAASNTQDGSGMMLAQIRRTQWKFERDLVAGLQHGMNMLRGHATRNAANMEFQVVIAMPVGHGVATGGRANELDLRILPRREQHGSSVRRRNPHLLDIVGEIIEPDHDRVQAPWRLDSIIVVAAQPGDSRVRLRQRAARQNQAVGFLFLGERKARVLEQFHLALDQPGLAGTAATGPATVGIRNAGDKRSVENGLPLLDFDTGPCLPDIDELAVMSASSRTLCQPKRFDQARLLARECSVEDL